MKQLNKINKKINVIFAIALCIQMLSCNNNDETSLRALPVAAFEASSVLVELEDAIIFTDASFDQDGEISAWSWSFGDGNTSAEQSPTYIYQEVGEYVVTLTVTDNDDNTSDNVFTTTITIFSTEGVDPTILWSYAIPYYSTHVSVAVSDNETVYVGTDGKASDPTRGDNVLAINNGSLLWSDVTENVVRMSPVVAPDGTVYFGDYTGVLFAYNSDGSLKWDVDLGALVKYSSPAIASDGTIYIGMENTDVLHAVNPTDGSIIWTYDVGHDIRATPVVDSSGVIYVASSDDIFYAINPDGTLKWQTTYGDYTSGTPTIAESVNTIYLSGKTSDNTGHLIAYNMTDGSVIWDNDSRPSAKLEQGGPTIATDGTIYVGGEDNKMVAYNPDGTIKWEYEALGSIFSAPALDNEGNLYFGDAEGYFYVVDPDGNNEWATIKLDENIRRSTTIGSNGNIYILTRNDTDRTGTLFAIQTDATGLMDSEWPMLSKNANHTGRY